MNKNSKIFRAFDIANQLLQEDEVIDIIATFNNVDIKILVTANQATIIYPPEYLNIGIRGSLTEIREILSQTPGRFTTVELASILGNEPLNITLTDFKTTSILKQPQRFTGKDTFIGIIDTGIDYTNQVFIDNKGETRIEGIWDQTIGNQSVYGYGTIYNKETINKALKNPDPFSVVPHKDEVGEGTMLVAIAAGSATYKDGIYRGVATEANLIVVKLKPASPALQGIYHTTYNPLGFSALDVALGVQYICSVATQLGKPVSICFPLGTNTGPHDASDPLSNIMGTYASNRGIAMVLAAGDEANKGHHASGNLKENNVEQVKLIIPKSQEGFIVEIWASFGDKIEVSLIPPQLESVPDTVMILNKLQNYELSGGSSVFAEGSKLDPTNGCQIIRFRLNRPIPGDWTLHIRGIIVMNGTYNIWIPKTGMLLPGTMLLPASPFVTIYNSSASGGGITVGCYNETASTACAGSGRGPTRDNRTKPDFLVNGMNIFAPLPENKWGIITGTAPSSAITAGFCTFIYEKQLQQKTDLANTVMMRALLIEQLTQDHTILYPDPSRGYGLLDINTVFY